MRFNSPSEKSSNVSLHWDWLSLTNASAALLTLQSFCLNAAKAAKVKDAVSGAMMRYSQHSHPHSPRWTLNICHSEGGKDTTYETKYWGLFFLFVKELPHCLEINLWSESLEDGKEILIGWIHLVCLLLSWQKRVKYKQHDTELHITVCISFQ